MMASTGRQYIGRIMFSEKRPARPGEFWCWLSSDNASRYVQVGSVLAIDGENERYIAEVVDMFYESETQPSQEVYGHEGGNPNVNLPIRPRVLKYAKLRVLYKTPLINAPPEGRWGVRYATEHDAEIVSGHIPPRNRVLAGFVSVGYLTSEPSNWCPVYLNSEMLLGPETAHCNITGVTGMAAKTSYGLFLSYSAMAWAMQHGIRLAVILFNVKREDFLRLEKLPKSWEEAFELINQWASNIARPELAEINRGLWEATRIAGVDHIGNPIQVQYFTYNNDPYYDTMNNPRTYSYGLGDLSAEELVAAMYSPDETGIELQVSFIHRYHADHIAGQQHTFEQMIRQIETWRDAARRRSQDSQRQITEHPETLAAVLRRLHRLGRRAARILDWNHSTGRPITFRALQEGFNVVQLYGLNDEEKRIVFNAVLREIRMGLELPPEQRQVDRVIIVVDELNLYAPKGRSPVKDQVREIAARGRDLGLSLIGMQQFASHIDEQVLGNSLTRVVGRSERNEVANRDVYGFLGDLRDIAPDLDTGQVIVSHPAHKAPLILRFPVPLHHLTKQHGPLTQTQNHRE